MRGMADKGDGTGERSSRWWLAQGSWVVDGGKFSFQFSQCLGNKPTISSADASSIFHVTEPIRLPRSCFGRRVCSSNAACHARCDDGLGYAPSFTCMLAGHKLRTTPRPPRAGHQSPQRAIMVLRPGATRMRSLHGTALELYPNTTQHHTALLSLVK